MINHLIHIPILKRLIPSILKKIYKLSKKNRGFFQINKVEMFLDFFDPIDREIILFKEFEKEEISFLIRQLKYSKAKIFIDIGSNCGYYSILISHNNCVDKIFAFDPNRDANFKFKKTLKKNQEYAKKINLYNIGLSNRNSKLKIKSFKKDNFVQTGGSSIVKTYTKGSYVESFENFKKGDDILKISKSIIGIKIDVEGYEFEVLEGLKKTIKQNNCIIQIEIFNRNFTKIKNYLISLNFRLIKKIEKRSNYFFKNF